MTEKKDSSELPEDTVISTTAAINQGKLKYAAPTITVLDISPVVQGGQLGQHESDGFYYS